MNTWWLLHVKGPALPAKVRYTQLLEGHFARWGVTFGVCRPATCRLMQRVCCRPRPSRLIFLLWESRFFSFLRLLSVGRFFCWTIGSSIDLAAVSHDHCSLSTFNAAFNPEICTKALLSVLTVSNNGSGKVGMVGSGSVISWTCTGANEWIYSCRMSSAIFKRPFLIEIRLKGPTSRFEDQSRTKLWCDKVLDVWMLMEMYLK